MKFSLKSKMGFTLIELLVVIGILAVLAAIAIPSVAGLIDRANVSADATNANEMTNAIERFTSEYELYCQDLASGRVKTGDLDSAQGRVFNVTGADSREDIELLESTGLNGKQINRDTKYPTNATTMQSLVENYMKTSSTTFTPKQSDCHYYYSPDCGIVVCTETAKSSTTDLNKLIQSGKDAKGNTLGTETQWIDLTLGSTSSSDSSSSETIVGSVKFYGYYDDYYDFIDEPITLTWEELQLLENGDKYSYDASAINDTSIGDSAFDSCSSLTSITIPNSVTSIGYNVFGSCYALTSITIPNSITSIDSDTFLGCYALTSITIPNSVTSIGSNAFAYSGLTNITIPNSVTSIDTHAFQSCENLTNITIPNSVTSIGDYAFAYCPNLQDITFNGTKAQWNAISLGGYLNEYTLATVIHCTDGDVAI